MEPILHRLTVAITCVWLTVAGAANAQTRPATLDDVLAMQTFGTASLSPDDRWLVYERQGAYDGAPRYDLGVRSGWAATSLYRVSTAGGMAEPLLSASGGAAYLLGPWSPDARRLVVFRLEGDRFEVGVVSMDGGIVHWTGLTPDWSPTGLSVGWLGSDRLALTVRKDGRLPLRLRFDATGLDVLSDRWETTRVGQAASRLRVDTSDGAMMIDEPLPAKAVVVLAAPFDRPRTVFEGATRDIEPSPDGRWLAMLVSGEPTSQTWEERAVQSAVLRRTRLSFIEVATGAMVTPLPDIDVAPHLLRWSENSRRVLVWRRTAGSSWRDGALSVIGPTDATIYDTAGLEPWAAGAQADELRPVRADWLAGEPILYASGADGRFDWWSLGAAGPINLTRRLTTASSAISGLTRREVMLFGDDALWAIDAQGRQRRLTSSRTKVRSGQQSNPMETLRTRVNDAPRRAWALAAAGEQLQIIERGDGPVWEAIAPCDGQRKVLAARRTRLAWLCVDRGVETLRLATPTGVRAVEQLNAQFADLALSIGRPVNHRDRLGRPVRSLLFLPPDRSAREVRGVIVLVYPGGQDDGQSDGSTLHMGLRPQLLTMGGYAVLSAALPGQKDSEPGAFLDDVATGVEGAVDAMLNVEPGLDRRRIAIAGHSFGGYAALATATRATRYGAYVAWAAPTDPASRWGEPSPGGWLFPQERLNFGEAAGGVERGQNALGDPPWRAPESYQAASLAQQAETIDAPVLLITSDRDYVPATQAQRMFAALHRLGKPARLLTYWGEGHDNASPGNIRDVYAQIFAFLDASFSGEPERSAVDLPMS